MKSSGSPALGALIFLVLFGGAITAVVYNLRNGKKNAAKIDALFDGYFSVVRAGKLDDAWQQFTTPHYREQYPLDAYKKTWQTRVAQHGAMTRFENRGASRTHVIGHSAGWSVVVNLYFERNHAPTATYYLEDQPDGTLLIERSSTASGARNPYGEAW